MGGNHQSPCLAAVQCFDNFMPLWNPRFPTGMGRSASPFPPNPYGPAPQPNLTIPSNPYGPAPQPNLTIPPNPYGSDTYGDPAAASDDDEMWA